MCGATGPLVFAVVGWGWVNRATGPVTPSCKQSPLFNLACCTNDHFLWFPVSFHTLLYSTPGHVVFRFWLPGVVKWQVGPETKKQFPLPGRDSLLKSRSYLHPPPPPPNLRREGSGHWVSEAFKGRDSPLFFFLLVDLNDILDFCFLTLPNPILYNLFHSTVQSNAYGL